MKSFLLTWHVTVYGVDSFIQNGKNMVEWKNCINATFHQVAPKGLPCVFTAMCGACSNEYAIQAAFLKYADRQRKGSDFTNEEKQTAPYNKPPGCPELSILSFEGTLQSTIANRSQCY